jgi:hypothetical protein
VPLGPQPAAPLAGTNQQAILDFPVLGLALEWLPAGEILAVEQCCEAIGFFSTGNCWPPKDVAAMARSKTARKRMI